MDSRKILWTGFIILFIAFGFVDVVGQTGSEIFGLFHGFMRTANAELNVINTPDAANSYIEDGFLLTNGNNCYFGVLSCTRENSINCRLYI